MHDLCVHVLTANCHTASACNHTSENMVIVGYLGSARLLQQQQNTVLFFNMETMHFLPSKCP